MQDRPCSE